MAKSGTPAPPNPMEVFEGTIIRVGMAAKGKPAEESADFIFTQVKEDGSTVELEPVTVEIPKGKNPELSGQLETPPVPEADDFYRLKYKVKVGADETPKGQEWLVWRKKVEVVSKCQVDDALTVTGDRCTLLVNQNGDSKPEPMPLDGKLVLTLSKPGKIELNVKSPARWKTYLDDKKKGKERIFEYEIAPAKAKIISPVPMTDGPRKTYVNMRKDGLNCVDMHIRTTGADGAVPKQPVFWECNFTNPTLRGKGSPEAPDENYRKERTIEGLNEPEVSNEGMTWKGQAESDDKGDLKFKLYLGKGGGETCEFKVGTTNTVEDETIQFETWRKLHVQFTHTGSPTASAIWPDGDKRQQTVDCYKKLFIELDFQPDLVLPKPLDPAMTNENDRSGWYPASELDLKGNDDILLFNTAGDTWKEVAKGTMPQDWMDGTFVNVITADQVVDYKVLAGTQNHQGTNAADLLSKLTKEGNDYFFELTGKEMSPSDESMSFGPLPVALRPAKISWSIIDARMPRPPDPKDEDGDMPGAGNLTLVADKSVRGRMRVKISGELIAKIQAVPGPVALQLLFNVLMISKSNFAGLSDGGMSILVMPESNLKELNNTISHEIGHALNMVCDINGLVPDDGVNRVPDFTVVEHPKGGKTLQEHPWWYTGRGHLGGHCANGIGQSTYDKWGKLDGNWNNKGFLGKYTCVIYGQAQWKHTPETFCPECEKILLAMEVWTGKMPQ